MTEDDDPLGPYNDVWSRPVKIPSKWTLYGVAFVVWAVLASPWVILALWMAEYVR